MNKVRLIYEILLSRFGPQGWWPLASKGGKPGYDQLGYGRSGSVSPKTDSERFDVCMGAILTQNTSWKNVQKAIRRLKEEKLIDVMKIAAVDEKELAATIRPSGYYNQKARKLKAFANHVMHSHGGSLKRMFSKNAAELRNELLSVHGIGPETADDIILYAAEKPVFVVDAYTRRVFSRIGTSSSDSYEKLQQLFHKNLPKDTELYKQYHALLVELAKSNCRKSPACGSCPVNSFCSYYKKVVRGSGRGNKKKQP